MNARSLLLLLCAACHASSPDPRKPDTTPVLQSAPTDLPRFRDADLDGSPNSEDCDDADPDIRPGAREICDGVDQDCDGEVDERVLPTWYEDNDGDGYGEVQVGTGCTAPEPTDTAQGGDCDDTNYLIHQDASEVCNGVDDDCDRRVDEGLSTDWYADDDGDGFGDSVDVVESCADLVGGRTTTSGDCDDGDASTYPLATEQCEDGIDQDCDGDDTTCAMNTADVHYVACSAWAPYDVDGASWTWRYAWGDTVTTWITSNAGAGTYEGLNIWLVKTTGVEYYEDDYFEYGIIYNVELGVTCEEDGLHLVYETYDSTYDSTYGTSYSSSAIQFSDRPLVMPATLTEGDTWTVDKVAFSASASDPDTYDPATYTTLVVGGTEALTVDGEEVEGRLITATQAGGAGVSWWAVEGLGVVSRGNYAVIAYSGL